MVEKRRDATIDFFRVIASILVILIHTAVREHTPILYFISVTVGRYAVPFFMVVSGYFYFLKPGKERLKKILSNVLWLWFIWNIIYIPNGIYTLSHAGSIKEVIFELVWSIIGESVCFGAAWYLMAFAAGLFIVDWFRRIDKMWMCDILAVIVLLVDCASTNYQHIFPYISVFSKIYWGTSIITGILWLTVAYYITKYRNKASQIGKWWAVLIAILLTVGERLMVQHFGVNNDPIRTDMYLTLPISVFLIFMFILNHSHFESVEKVVTMRDMATLMFFIQFGILDALKLTIGGWYFVIVLVLDVLISTIILKLSKKITFLRKIY